MISSLPVFRNTSCSRIPIWSSINRHPGDTILAGGVNIQDVVDGAQVDKGASHVYFVDENLDLPSTGKFLLILRSDKGKNKKHPITL